MSDLYDKYGWLNFEYIDSLPTWLNVIIGARQVGKTYGTLLTMLRKNYYHMLLRRTTDELDMIAASPDLNPYQVFEPEYHVGFFRQSKKLCRICDYISDENGNSVPGDQRGIATSLPQIGHVRGFNGSAFTDLVFDEVVPEKGVITRKAEGEMFLNAYVTVNGNRELAGMKPLRAWLLSNTNRIDSPILESLNLIDDILYMRRKEKEELITDKGVLILQPGSVQIVEARAETALMQQIEKKSDFYGMAINNEFAYDASPYVKTLSIKGMQPAWCYNDEVYCWQHSQGFYINRAPFKKGDRYEGSRTGRESLYMNWSVMKPYYYSGMITFSDLKMLSVFKNIFDIE